MKRKFISVSASILTFLFLLSFAPVKAFTGPEIKDIEDRTATSLTLKVSYPDYAGKDVDFKVKITNKKTGKKEIRTFKDEDLDDDGEENLVIDDLNANTKYSFKVKIKKHSKKVYSAYSESETEKTKSN